MSNQEGDSFKFLWPFQNVRTLHTQETQNLHQLKSPFQTSIHKPIRIINVQKIIKLEFALKSLLMLK